MSRATFRLDALLSSTSPQQPSSASTVRSHDDRRIDDRRIEVEVTHLPDGRRQVLLRDLSYGPGIGWYAQKTIRLDARQLEALMGELCCLRQAPSSKSESSSEPRGTDSTDGEAQILRFEKRA
ncbi:MAG: hypothetical protein O7J95_01050 [Planctomycetota bacterium]|nr:hypothetical protein [Planctomycetota bacterium]